MFRLSAFMLLSAFALTATNIAVNPNPPLVVQSVSDAATGADLTGLVVSVTYLVPGVPGVVPRTFTSVWAPTGATSGAAGSLPGPVLSLTGDAGANLAWVFDSQLLSLLQSITLDGSSAGILFDRSSPNPGTPGSGAGADIAFGPLLQADTNAITVTYSGAVSLNGSAPLNDLYSKITIDFSALPTTGLIPQSFQFTQDTDRAVLTPEPPASLLFIAACIFAFVFKTPRVTF